jgi:hypothetical protein
MQAAEITIRSGRDNNMNKFLRVTKLHVICMASACLVLGATTSAYAVPQRQVVTVNINQIFTGLCCFSWNTTAFVNEPSRLTPVTVRWSADFLQNTANQFAVGLSINGGDCRLDLGPNSLGNFAVDFRSFMAGSWEWIVLPTDGLTSGLNSFTICGGATTTATAKVTIGSNTLAVRTSK